MDAEGQAGPGRPGREGMSTLVTLDEAKDHAKPGAAKSDPELQRILDAAEATILDYVGSTAYWREQLALWTAETVPRFVHHAILIQFAEFDRFRGDDLDGPARIGTDLAPVIVALLSRTRDPVLA